MVPDRDDALDLTQEIFLKAYEGLGRFREGSSFYTWLYRIAVNACIDFNRRRRRSVEPRSLSDDLLAEIEYEPVDDRPASDPEKVLANKELRAQLHAAIHSLPEPFRLTILLRDIEGLSLNEIARILNCPLGTVKTRLHRGRHELRQRLVSFIEGGEP
jgi:RNA polymerase sigma-70 factor (ECF subfamily)